MTSNENRDKNDVARRVLELYARLSEGYTINKAVAARDYGVSERSIQRDIEEIRSFLDEELLRTGVENQVVYDRAAGGYRMESIYKTHLTNAEVLAICKILLDSRAFEKTGMTAMLDKLISRSVPEADREAVRKLIRNEEAHYEELQHHKDHRDHKKLIDNLWTIGQAISTSKYIEIEYRGLKGSEVKTRRLRPLAIMFSEFYFYLVAFLDDEAARKDFSVPNDPFPTIYRVDRILSLKVPGDHFRIERKDRFEEGEFRRRIQFMFGGRLRKIRFTYSGMSVESVLDRLPTAVIEKEENGVYTIYAEVFGDGIDMWLRSQGDAVELVE